MKGFSVDLQFGNPLAGLQGVWAGRRTLLGGLYVIQVRNEQGQDEAPLVGRGNGWRARDERGRPRILRGREALRVRSPESAWEVGVLLSLG